MKKGYLVELNYHDGCDYEPMTNEWMIAVFENREDAEAFCRDNSDSNDGFYFIKKERTIQIGDREPIKIEFDKWEYSDDDDNDDDFIREKYWFEIYEVNIV